MASNRTLFLVITSLLFLCGSQPAGAADAPRIPCSNILDVPSGTLLREGVLGGSDVFYLDGRLCSSDDGEPTRCDWEYSIREVTVLRPVPKTHLRFVESIVNHKTGSGAWNTIIGFECRDGHVTKIFERRFLYGVKFEALSASSFALSGGHWVRKDPMAGPSRRKRLVYRWDSAAHAYKMESETFFKWNPTTRQYDEPVEKPSASESWGF